MTIEPVIAALRDLWRIMHQRDDTQRRLITQLDLIPLIEASAAGNGDIWCEDINLQLRNFNSATSRSLIETELEPRLLAASFDSPGNPKLRFEYLIFDEVKPDRLLACTYSSHARSINVIECSPGLNDQRVVALFPEDLRFTDKRLRDSTPTLFFIDRFVDRFERYSVPLLRSCISQQSFVNLQKAILEKREGSLAVGLCADWMWMHEGGHRDGRLPYKLGTLPGTSYFAKESDLRLFKNTWESGAFEEMRADVLGMCKLLTMESAKNNKVQLLLEFILFERLVRYPVQYLRQRPSERIDYDSLGSQVLYSFLETHHYLTAGNGVIHLHNNWPEGLEKYGLESETVEDQAIDTAETATDAELIAFKNRYMEKVAADRHLNESYRIKELNRIQQTTLKDDQQTLRRWIGREVIERYVQSMCQFDTRSKVYPVFPFYQAAAARLAAER